MPLLLRSFGLEAATPSERRAAGWIAVMFGAGLASMFLLRPLRDQFGVHAGVDSYPRLYTWTLLATTLAVLPFWWLANRMPSRRFVPLILHVCTGLVVVLALALAAIGDYDWSSAPKVGEWFWGAFSALNVVVPTLVWIHAVEHCRTDQARRLFGLIAFGGTVGAVVGSWLAGQLCDGLDLPPWTAACASAVLLQGMLVAFRCSLPACRELGSAADAGRVASGGVFEGLRILLQSGRARAIAAYMMLLGILATAFAAAETELVGAGVAGSREQHFLLASVEFWSQSLVLVLQLFMTGRLLQRWPAAVLLVSLPVVSVVGLAALWIAPVVLTINLVRIGRRGAQFAFEKPAREVLYAPLALATKHKVKFLLDTFAFRLGDLFGAWLAVGLRASGLGVGTAAGATTLVALVWIALGLRLGRRERQPASTS